MAGAGAAACAVCAVSAGLDRVYATRPTIASTSTMPAASSGVDDRPGSDGGAPEVDEGF